MVNTIWTKLQSGCCKQTQYYYGHMIAVVGVAWISPIAVSRDGNTAKKKNDQADKHTCNSDHAANKHSIIMAMLLPLLVLCMDLCGGFSNNKVEIINRRVHGD